MRREVKFQRSNEGKKQMKAFMFPTPAHFLELLQRDTDVWWTKGGTVSPLCTYSL